MRVQLLHHQTAPHRDYVWASEFNVNRAAAFTDFQLHDFAEIRGLTRARVRLSAPCKARRTPEGTVSLRRFAGQGEIEDFLRGYRFFYPQSFPADIDDLLGGIRTKRAVG